MVSKMNSTYFAHISKDKKRYQTLIEHSYAVKELCERKGEKISLSKMAGLTGLLHDVGKYSNTFQHYLLNGGIRGSVKHSFVGAQLLDVIIDEMLANQSKSAPIMLFNEILSNVILAHHSSLKDMRKPDGTSLYLSSKETIETYIELDTIYLLFLQDIQQKECLLSIDEAKNWIYKYVTKALKEFLRNIYNKLGNSQRIYVYTPFITKTLYSILIDSDRVDTSLFMNNQNYTKVDFQDTLKDFQLKLDNFSNQFKKVAKHNLTNQQIEINRLRQKISEECKVKAKWQTGLYQLLIPTGGGKTISSMRFALNHAVYNKKDRIIYVVPYTSIVEQNADVIRKALDDSDLVFEHHSNIQHPIFDDDEDQIHYTIKQANREETWEMPIIFTTAVQFLNTLLKNKSKYNRRLHNLMNSVIIVDELQSLPQHTIHLFNEAANFLTHIGNTSVVLCTATQPTLDQVTHSIEYLSHQNEQHSIVQLTSEEKDYFQRATVKFEIDPCGWNTEQIAEHVLKNAASEDSVLIILNTKSNVKKLYKYLMQQKVEKVYYLTTNLCAVHRQEIIKKIKDDLKNKTPIICISTSLIEAGVDISFSIVYRALTGLDSIAQAIGRCNRNGEILKGGRVFVFKHAEERHSADFYMKQRKKGTEIMLKQFDETIIFSDDVIKEYFKFVFTEINDMVPTIYGEKSLYKLLFPTQDFYTLNPEKSELAHFAMYDLFGAHFKVIDADTKGILVPYKVSYEELIAMNYSVRQRYSINVYEQTFKKLLLKGAIDIHKEYDVEVYLLKPEFYDESYGIVLNY